MKLFSVVLVLAIGASLQGSEPAKVDLIRTPDDGIQPQAVVDDSGTLHLIYLKGDPGGSDIFYVRRRPGQSAFSAPIRVNSQPGSAVAIGTVRGAHLAVGKQGRVHVAWMDLKNAEPKGPPKDAMLYARSNLQGTAFEPQRNVLQFAAGVDGGASVAADRSGNVYVVWHAGDGEPNRRVWVARSRDDGKTFARETAAYDEPTGACACCGMRAFADRKGDVYVLYRSAKESVNRDIYMLLSASGGQSFKGVDLHPWKVNGCPMSTASITEGGGVVLAALETMQQVYYAEVEPGTLRTRGPVAAPGEGSRKHPAVAANSQGERILVWTEGTGWKKGGSLAWQVYDKANRPTTEKGQAPGVPIWSLAAVFARPDGGFSIVY